MAVSSMRAAVFSRESKGKGSSIEDQDRENLDAAEEIGAEVLHTLRDRVSASRFGKKRRDGWPEVIRLVKSGRLDLLILWEVSRGDRTMDSWTPFLTACREHGVQIYVTSDATLYNPKVGAHRRQLLDAGAAAEEETEKLSARSRKGIRGAVRDGKAHGRSAFGYTREYGPIIDGKRTFTEVPNEHIGVAVEVITRIAKREPIAAIERDLNARPAAERGDRMWTRKTIRYVATNPVYVGVRRHRGADGTDEAPGNWPPASDAADWEETFWRAQGVLSEPGRRHAGPSGTAKYLLSYWMVCTSCEDPVVATHPTGESLRYRCPAGCSSVPVADADGVIFSTVFAVRYRPDVFELLGGDQRVLTEAEGEMMRLERKIERARQAYDDDVIDEESLGRKLARIKPELDVARRRAAEARQASAAFSALADLFDEGAEYATAREKWEARSIIERRAIIKRCFSRVELHRATRRLTRHATREQRIALANERIKAILVGEKTH
jgi:site-specific DNA recombinase